MSQSACSWPVTPSKPDRETLAEAKLFCSHCTKGILEFPFLQCAECEAVRYHLDCYSAAAVRDGHLKHYLLLCRTQLEFAGFCITLQGRRGLGTNLLTDAITGPWKTMASKPGWGCWCEPPIQWEFTSNGKKLTETAAPHPPQQPPALVPAPPLPGSGWGRWDAAINNACGWGIKPVESAPLPPWNPDLPAGPVAFVLPEQFRR